MQKAIKLYAILFIAVLALGIGAIALADEATDEVTAQELEVSEQTLLPNSPFYFLKEWGRGIQSFFTFGQLKKAGLEQQFASERLLEIQALVNGGKIDSTILERATEKYERSIDKIKTLTDKIEESASENEGFNKFLEKFTKHQMLHQRVLERLQGQVPEDVMQRMEQTRERHMKRFGEVMQRLEANKGQFNRIKEGLKKGKINAPAEE